MRPHRGYRGSVSPKLFKTLSPLPKLALEGMFKSLLKIEDRLPDLLKDANMWNSLYVDYLPPIVERVWRQYGENRIYLHRIHSCKPEEAFFHPHPWPSAIRIVKGSYEMGIGYGSGVIAPPLAAVVTMSKGSFYEMSEINGWHYVRPLDGVVMSLMVTGKPWNRQMPVEPEQSLRELSETSKNEIIDFFKKYYGVGK